ncbi:MAG: efflux RND transporter periplasmic adaptor subunit [Planctomycetota bacterium]|nr:MAG: efflux RND transporter periplasmic adaptor subunit [Planctomycetota bacterium]
MSTTTRQDAEHKSKFASVLEGTDTTTPMPARRRRRIPRWLVAGVVACGVIGAVVVTLGSSGLLQGQAPTARFLTEEARRTDLIISVAEDGTLESAHNTDVKCEVPGGSTILWIIPDGTRVNQGDELVRLDSAGIQEEIDLQRIAYEKAKAIKIEAEKNFEAAKIAVQEYVEGMFVQELQTLQVAATVAKENLESARNTLNFTERMHRKGYVTTLQRDAQAFAVQRARLDLDVAEKAIEVLEKFTKPKTVVGLESVRDAAEAKMASEDAALKLEEDRLKRLEVELEKCVITAPADGMVVYAKEQGRRSEGVVIEEGALVRERQTIIQLPDLSHMQVKCTVHESKIDSLKRGMRARIKVQDRELQGIVTSVANQPEPSNWFSGSVKEYAATVAIESDTTGLRPGMTAAVEILVANLSDVLSVPVQAVVEKKGKFYCWVATPGGAEKCQVELGLGNNTRIQINSGLKEGDRVLLNPRDRIAEAREEDRTDGKVNVKERFGGDKPAEMPAEAEGGQARKPAGGSAGLMSADADGDGKVSREEAPEQVQNFFDRIDSDSDGFISSSEAAAAAAARKRMQEQAAGGGPGGPGRGGP